MTNFRQRKDLGNNISKNKFNDKPPYKFNNKDIKEINIKNIKLNENDISYNNKKYDIKWYNKFKAIWQNFE